MSSIQKAFGKGKALVAFVTCGDPDLETTAAVVREAVANGADLIELGIPFSDPTAEGPVIQAASLRALEGGVTTDKVLSLARSLRRDVEVPLAFMTYANVVFSRGAERFAADCAGIGIDALIIPDLPFEERGEFLPACRRHGVALVPLVAPTSGSRVAMIAGEAEGFLYVVSSLGVTGERAEIGGGAEAIVAEARRHTDIPCAVGFGISTPEQARRIAAFADGVIVGSAIMRLVERHGREAPRHVGEYVRAMKAALN